MAALLTAQDRATSSRLITEKSCWYASSAPDVVSMRQMPLSRDSSSAMTSATDTDARSPSCQHVDDSSVILQTRTIILTRSYIQLISLKMLQTEKEICRQREKKHKQARQRIKRNFNSSHTVKTRTSKISVSNQPATQLSI